MAEHSKPGSRVSDGLLKIIINALVGSTHKKVVSAVVLAVIAYLIYMKNKKSSTDYVRLREDSKTKKSVSHSSIQRGGKGNVDGIFLSRIRKLVNIVIPTWKCKEVLDLCLLTVFLVLRTFLSIYIAALNGTIVKSIIEGNKAVFIVKVCYLGLIAIPASFVNSFLDFLNKRLAINFKRRLTNYFHESYLKDMTFYQLANLDSRIANPDQRLTADI